MKSKDTASRRSRIILAIIIFLLAFGVRLLSWHDTRLEVGKVQTVVTGDYQRVAGLLRQGGVASFFSSSSPLSDLNTLGHPPGYSILIAIVQSVFGDANSTVQFVQIFGDSVSAVVIFLIVTELLSFGAACIAGALASLSPQFAWNSVLLLPDSLAVLPILLAVYCLARAAKNPRLRHLVIAGVLVGISCWLRANAMLLPLFLAAALLFLFPWTKGKRYSLALIGAALLIVLPLTLRNAIVFRRFIPLSLGAGQTLLEGIADYDQEGRFNIPKTDMGIMKQEAEDFGRPDYYSTLFNPDGVERERARLRRGFGVIRSHPIWFAGVMARRAGSMVRLERSRLVSARPPVSHALDSMNNPQPAWSGGPAEWFANDAVKSPQATVAATTDGAHVLLNGDGEKYGEQLSSPPVRTKQNEDYVVTVPVKLRQGRMRISVQGPAREVFSSSIVETQETKTPDEQPLSLIELPFVTTQDPQVRIVFSNEASNPNPVAEIGQARLFELGPARSLWTRPLRFVVRGLQRIFLTAVILPLAIIGLIVLLIKKQRAALIILLVVPIYFFCVQSIVHTEYRYVLAVDYFLFALAGVAVCWIVAVVKRFLPPRARTSFGARTSSGARTSLSA